MQKSTLHTRNKLQQGFTLIEMMVVIAIIGLLASIVLTALSTARIKARDAKRMADLRQLNSAIQLYINDNGHAPYLGAYNCSVQNEGDGNCSQVNEVNSIMWAALKADLHPYMTSLPTDPCGVKCYDPNQGYGGFYAYVYTPPSGIAAYCDSHQCGLSEDILNTQYLLFAEHMEAASPLLNFVYRGVPTFGFKGTTFGSSY